MTVKLPFRELHGLVDAQRNFEQLEQHVLDSAQNLLDLASPSAALGALLGQKIGMVGTGTLTWTPGGVQNSDILTVTVPGTTGTVIGVACSGGGLSGDGRQVAVGVAAAGGGQVSIQGTAWGVNPAAGSTAPVTFVLWGS